MLGIQHTLDTIKDLEGVTVDALKLAKDAAARRFIQVFGDIVSTGSDVQALVADAPQAMPELKDLDASEVAQLGAAAYGLVTAVIAALKG